jgi:hypothetical protein
MLMRLSRATLNASVFVLGILLTVTLLSESWPVAGYLFGISEKTVLNG